MKITKLFCGSVNSGGQSFDRLQKETGKLMQKNLSQLDRFTRKEMPSIVANQQASLDALEQLSRMAKAALKK